jgi:hypothetical protein
MRFARSLTLGSRFIALALGLFVPALAQSQQPTPAITLVKINTTESAAKVSSGVNASTLNYRPFADATVGKPTNPELFTLRFNTATKLTAISTTRDFKITGGSCTEGHTYIKGDQCSMDIFFTPQGPGHRTGKLSVTHTASITPFLTPIGGTAYGPAISFTPSQIETIPGTLSGTTGTLANPQGLTTDGGDSLYIADTGNNLIKKIDSSGVISTLVGGGAASAVGYSGFGSGIALTNPRSVAVDYSGAFYIADTGDNVVLVNYIDGIINTRIGGGATGSSCSFTSPCLPYNVKITAPYAVATDSSGNVYATLQVGGSLPGFYIAENQMDNNNYYLLNTTAYNYYTTSPSVAVDAYSNLYYTYDDPGGPLLSPTPLCYVLAQNRAYSTSAAGQRFWTVAGAGKCGFSGDGGRATGAEISTNIGEFAFDAAGNFYFADTGNNRIRRVDVLNGVIRTVAGNGAAGFTGDGGPSTSAPIQTPTGLAVDSTGQVYTTGLTSGTTLKADIRSFGTIGTIAFGAQLTGAHSAAQTVLVSNVGNDTLNISHMAINGGNAGDFVIDPNSTSCLTTVPLYSGHSCMIGVIFTPVASGARSATLTVVDDTVATINTILLTGTGTNAAKAVLSPTSLAFASTVVGVQTAALNLTLTNSGGLPLTLTSFSITGTNNLDFSQTHTCGATLAAGANCTISVKFKPTAAGARTAIISPVTSAGTITATLTGTGLAPAKAVLSPTALTFASQAIGTTSAAQTVTLSNSGGVSLSVTSIGFTGTNPTFFAQTHTCGATVAAAGSCTISVTFKPTAIGTPAANLSVVTSAGTVTTTLKGTSTAAAKVKVTLTSMANPAPSKQFVALTSKVASASAIVPTGKVQLKEGTRILSVSTLAHGSATFRFLNLTVGKHLLTAYYLGDKQHAASQSQTVRQIVGDKINSYRP